MSISPENILFAQKVMLAVGLAVHAGCLDAWCGAAAGRRGVRAAGYEG